MMQEINMSQNDEGGSDERDTPKESDASAAGRALGKLGASKGGKARAEKLTPEERSEIARKAVEARWAKTREDGSGPPAILNATHGSEDHPLRIFNITIPCYVLEGETRVITNRGLQRSLGWAESGGAQRLADLMERFSAKGIDVKDLPARIAKPIEFRPKRGGRSAYGYEATVLADLCEVILAARAAGALTTKHEIRLGEHCELLVRGFARVGIIALVDEATGFETDKPKDDLRRILEAYIKQGELLPWAARFPIDFYREMFRLRGWTFDEASSKRPKLLRILTSELVYKKLPPGVYEELKKKNPPVYRGGSRKHRHHQFLTEEIGNPHLEKQILVVTTLMRVSDSWNEFKRLFQKEFPPGPERQRELDFPDTEEE
jgi:hypothetical protein